MTFSSYDKDKVQIDKLIIKGLTSSGFTQLKKKADNIPLSSHHIAFDVSDIFFFECKYYTIGTNGTEYGSIRYSLRLKPTFKLDDCIWITFAMRDDKFNQKMSLWGGETQYKNFIDNLSSSNLVDNLIAALEKLLVDIRAHLTTSFENGKFTLCKIPSEYELKLLYDFMEWKADDVERLFLKSGNDFLLPQAVRDVFIF